MSKNFEVAFVVLCVLSASRVAVAASALDELAAADQARVQNGEQVTADLPGQGSPWPQIRIYQRLESTPEEAMAVYSDYNLQHEYLSDIPVSQVTRTIDRATVEVSYQLETHFFLHPHENYVIREHLSTYDAGAGYRMDSSMVSADTMKASQGNTRFETLGTGTLLAYYVAVTPPGLASGEGNQEVTAMQKMVTQLIARIEQVRTENTQLLAQEVAALRVAVSPQ